MSAAPREVEPGDPAARTRSSEGAQPAVGRRPIERSAGRRKQPVEVRRRRDAGRLRPALDLETTAPQAFEGSLFALLDLRRFELVTIADRRCIDQAQQTFGRGGGGGRAIVAILRADVDGWVLGQTAPHEDVLELAGIGITEEHRMPREREAARARQVTADSERAPSGVARTAMRRSAPKRPVASALLSALLTTASSARRSPSRVRAPATRPRSRSMRAISVPYRMRAPRAFARSASASARRCMPPSTYQTPACST